MTDLVTAMVYTISKFVSMLFSMEIDPGISVGSFLLAVAVLGAVIRLIFSLVNVPGHKWGGESKDIESVPGRPEAKFYVRK